MDNNNKKAGLLDTSCLLVNVNRNCHTVSNALLTSAVITEHHLCPLFFVEYKKILCFIPVTSKIRCSVACSPGSGCESALFDRVTGVCMLLSDIPSQAIETSDRYCYIRPLRNLIQSEHKQAWLSVVFTSDFTSTLNATTKPPTSTAASQLSSTATPTTTPTTTTATPATTTPTTPTTPAMITIGSVYLLLNA